MTKKKAADHRTRLYRGSYERQTYLLRAELRIIRDDIRNLLSRVFVGHPISIMLDPDPHRIEQMADELMAEDRQRVKDKKKVKRHKHQHIGILVTFSNPNVTGRFETTGLWCITTGDRGYYKIEEGFLPDGWNISLQGQEVNPHGGIWFDPDHHKEVNSASEKPEDAKGPGD